MRPGPDPDFPYLSEQERFRFPKIRENTGSVVVIGGNLSPGLLLSAYEQGIFPWYNPEDPILWQSPDPRFVIFPENLHISSSMKKILRQGKFTVTFDQDFAAVIRSCAEMERPGQGGTWITGDIIAAYTELHRLGWAHSAESRLDGKLAGGCYGIRMGKAFFGESMFAKRPNASKAAFLTLARRLFADGIAFIDCQVPTDHLRSLGGEEMSRKDFLSLLRKTLAGTGDPGGNRA
jgi:leucyl/phenylalanyl-tRNA--protein transferase